MQGIGNQFLSRPAFTFDVDAGLRLGRLGNLFQNLFHLSASGNDVFEPVMGLHHIPKALDFLCESAFFETVPYLQQQVLIIKGLCQITVGSFAHGVDSTLDGAVSRQDQNRHIGIDLMKVQHEADTIFSGQFKVQECKIINIAFCCLYGLVRLGCRADAIPFGFKSHLYNFKYILIVIYHQNFVHFPCPSFMLKITAVKSSFYFSLPQGQLP